MSFPPPQIQLPQSYGRKAFFFHMKPKFLSSVHTAGHAESAKLLKIPQGCLRPLWINDSVTMG